MSPVRSPPRVAVWLLRRLVPGNYADALAGDLYELYQHGRGNHWYWRQVISAIVILRANRLRMAGSRLTKGVVAGFAVLALGIGTFTWAHAIRTDVDADSDCRNGVSSHASNCHDKTGRVP